MAGQEGTGREESRRDRLITGEESGQGRARLRREGKQMDMRSSFRKDSLGESGDG